MTPVSQIASLLLGRKRVAAGHVDPVSICVVATILMGIPLWALFWVGFLEATPPVAEWKTIHWTVVFASTWILISPALVAQWEMSALAAMLRQLGDFARRQGMEAGIVDRLKRAWPLAYLPSGFLFAAFTLFCFIFYRPYVVSDFAIPDGSAAYYLTLVISSITGFVSGIGVGGVIFAIWSLGRIFREKLEWQPFHADQRGGYGFLANFSVETAVLFSFGSVIVPAAVTIGYNVGWPLSIAIYGGAVFFAFMITMIFAWPVTALALNADRCRQAYLRDYSEGIGFAIVHSRALKGEATASVSLADIERAALHVAPAEKLIYMFDKIAQRSILPFRMTLLARIIVAGLAPIVLMIIQLFVERTISG